MANRGSKLAPGLLGAALLAGWGAAPVARAQDVSAAPVPVLQWGPCTPEVAAAQCARASVPLDYDEPDGETLELAVARIPATHPEERIGSLFLNPGGPGVSALELLLDGSGEEIGAQLGGRFDIVAFEPRGVAEPEPLLCFDNAQESAAFAAGLPAFPYLPEQQRPYFEAHRRLAARCAQPAQRILAHMSTADVARDMELLRRAVGDEQLSYLGFSYGSFIGATYANLFPDRVRAIAIDGVLDPQQWSSGWQVRSDRTNTQLVLEEFARLCDDAGRDACALAAPGGAAARFEALAQALLEKPLILPPDDFAFSYDALIAQAADLLSLPEVWGGPDGYGALLGALADAALDDAPPQELHSLGRAGRLRLLLKARLLEAQAQRALPYDNFLEAYLGNHCADARYPRTFSAWREIARYAAKGSRFGPFWWWFSAPCAEWPEAQDRYTGPWSARTAAPVLVIGNHFDAITGHAGAVSASRQLRGSRLLSYAGWGHGAFGRSSCATDHILAYLAEGALPDPGTVCPANPSPFAPEPEALGRTGRSVRGAGAAASGELRPWMLRPQAPVRVPAGRGTQLRSRASR